MTEQTAAVPPSPGKQVPAPQPQETAQDRVGKLRAQLAAAEAALPVPEGQVRVRVKGVPWFQAGQHVIGGTWQEINAGLLPVLEEAARSAGVELETEGRQ